MKDIDPKTLIDNFNEEHDIERIILIGEDGAIRQIIFGEENLK